MYRHATFALLALAATACTDPADDNQLGTGDTGPTYPEVMDVEINFHAVAGPNDFECAGRYPELGVNRSADVEFGDFRMFITGINLIGENSERVPLELEQNDFQNGDDVLLDFEDGSHACADNNGTPEMNKVAKGTVPGALYTGVEFTVGLPQGRSYIDPAQASGPLGVEDMYRDELNGRYFVKIEMTSAGEPDGFPVRISDFLCSLEEGFINPVCKLDSRAEYTFRDFDWENQRIVFDLAALLSTVDPNNNNHDTWDTPPGCISYPTDPDCGAIFINYGATPRAQIWATVE